MSIVHFTAEVATPVTGGDLNPAVMNFYLNDTRGSLNSMCADIIAFCSYLGAGEEAYIMGVSQGNVGVSGQLPMVFPAAEYDALKALDVNLKDFDAWGGIVGDAQPLAVAGTGAVIAKQTSTPGRSGRGRMTTPFLKQAGVTSTGTLQYAQKLAIASGYQQYIMRPSLGGGGTNMLKNATGTLSIVTFSISDTLGRVRSRRK